MIPLLLFVNIQLLICVIHNIQACMHGRASHYPADTDWWVNAVTLSDARQLAQVEVKGGTSAGAVVDQLASSMVRFLDNLNWKAGRCTG